MSVDDEPDYRHIVEHLAFVHVLIALGRSAEALPFLARLQQHAEDQGRGRHLVEIKALQAVALQVQGDTEQALDALAEVLSLAEPEGFVRTFVDIGEPMVELLHLASSRRIAPKYVARLLAVFADPLLAASVTGHAMVEPLTEREVEVLRLMAEGYSNREISERLFIAVGTAKSHVSNIYGKLGVSNRPQAVSRAKELNLV